MGIIVACIQIDTLGERRQVWLQLWKISVFVSEICGWECHGKRKFLSFFESPPLCQLAPALCCMNTLPYTTIENPEFIQNHSPSFKGHPSKTTHPRKKVEDTSNIQNLCLYFKVWMVFLGECMPEQEIFEKRWRFATFLTSSHSFLMGNFLQFFKKINILENW